MAVIGFKLVLFIPFLIESRVYVYQNYYFHLSTHYLLHCNIDLTSETYNM